MPTILVTGKATREGNLEKLLLLVGLSMLGVLLHALGVGKEGWLREKGQEKGSQDGDFRAFSGAKRRR